MKIGTRISADWLDRPEDLCFLTQIGVDCVGHMRGILEGVEDGG